MGTVSTVSFSNTPQAKDDLFAPLDLTEDSLKVFILDVMANDLGGNAKSLYSVDDGTCATGVASTDLLKQDSTMSTELSFRGAKIWITADGKVGYDASTLTAECKAQLQALNAGETLTDSFTYAIRLGNGTLSWATARISISGVNDAPVVSGVNRGMSQEDGACVTVNCLANASDVDKGAVMYVVGVPSHLPPGVSYDAATKSFQIDPCHSAYQHLAKGQTTDVVVNYGVSDGTTTTANAVKFVVTGSNDAPVVTAAITGSGTEDGASVTLDALATASDLDDGTTLTVVDLPASLPDGIRFDPQTHSFTLDPRAAAFQHLAMGQSETVTIEYAVSDGINKTPASVTFHVAGINDAPVALADAASGSEDSVLTGTVAGNDSDVDAGAVLTYSLDAAVAGLTLNADGSYSFDAGHATYQNLAQGATKAVAANYTVTDQHGVSSSSTLTITLTGTNDKPVAVADVNSGFEDSTITGSVAANDSDVDAGDALSYSLNASVAGLTLNADGSYSFDAGHAAYQNLAQGATKDVVASYTVKDQHGATSTSTLTITLTGTNDAPVAAADVNDGSEDTMITGSVATNDGDVDTDASLSYTLDAPVAGLTLNADGSYSFDASDAAYQDLAQGATKAVVANYTVSDEHGATSTSTLTITLTGTNDKPVAVVDVNSGSEDSTITGSVATNDSDVDADATLTYALDAPVAGLTLNENGSYSFNAGDVAYQNLAEGATKDVVASYTVKDQHGAAISSTLTITLTGTNDAPVAAAEVNDGSEDAMITGSVATNDGDVDTDAALTYTLDAPIAGLTLNADGSYSFDASDAAYQDLAQGATKAVAANYTVSDEHGATSTSTLTITLTGTNDAPVAVADVNSGSEDSTLTGSVATNDGDVDAGATLTCTLDTPVAGLTLNENGSYSFNAGEDAYQDLAEGATRDVVANYAVTDEHGATSTSTLTITLTGTNDAPVAVADVNSGSEDSTITGSVATNDGDVDADATLTYALDAPVAGLTLNENGSYSFNAGDVAYQNLAEGATRDVVANYTATDQHGATSTTTLTITLTGTNDKPVAVVDVNSGSEDSTITGRVATNDGDVDAGATLTYALDTPVAGLTLNEDGSYSFNAGDVAYQNLAEGATRDVVANYTVTDQHGATSTTTLTITLTGTNDAPVAVADVNSGSEDSTITGSVATNDGDVDADAALTYALDAPVAGLTLNENGSYSFDASDAAYQDLAQGATKDVAASYTVKDQHGATSTSTLTITLTGTNDAPVAAADVNDGSEDGTITGSVATNDGDVDTDASLTYTLDAPVAGLTLNEDGSYSFDASDAAYQDLAQGATKDVVASYTVKDQHGNASSSTLTITLTGTNDKPVAVDDINSGSEDSTITGSVATNDSDVDAGNALSYSLNSPVAGLTLDADGSYSFDAGHAGYQNLAQGATKAVAANYTVTDEHGATSTSTLTITLTGTNDAPVAVADVNSGSEDSTITGSVATNDGDVDAGATLTYTLDTPVAGLTLNENGSYSFNAGDDAYQDLAEGATRDIVANYAVTDEHGATSTSTLTITLTGTNDKPVAVVDLNSGSEDSTITGSVATNDGDVDTDASLTYTLDTPVAGLTLNENGSYSVNAGDDAYQDLAEGATRDVVANYTVTDEHGATSSSTLTITLTGTNDAPVAVADVNSGSEDSTITGNVATNDGDVDAGNALSYSLNAPVAGLTLNADGSYSFDAGDAAYQDLAQSATKDVVASYTVKDQHGAASSSTLTITLTGTNDAPVAVADVNNGSEDTTITGSVATNDGDVDADAALTYTLDAPIAGLTLNADGSYSFDASDAAYQDLAQGATKAVAANYTVTDEHGAISTSTLTITLTGTNDMPVAVADVNSGSEDSTITGSVATNDGDVDTDASLTYTLDTPVAGLTLNVDGSYSFDASDAAYQDLAQGATKDIVASYTVKDQHEASSTSTLTITLTGTNDMPVAVADVNSGSEDSTITGSVATNDGDVDTDASLTYTLDTPVAGLTLNADGSYSFDASDAAYQDLAQGATKDIVASYTVKDQHEATSTSTLTITLTGTNDMPVAVADVSSGSEDSTITGSVATNDGDVDTDASLTYTLDAPIAGLTLNADGSYSFDANDAAYQDLAQGATKDIVASYTVKDQHEATSTSTLTITLTGTNDMPVALVDVNSGSEDTTITGSVATNDGDVDTDAALTYTLGVPVAGMTLNADGSYSFNAGDAAYQDLAEGATRNVVANYTVTDQHGASSTSTLTITLTGTNDKPVAVVDVNSGSEDGTITGSVAGNDSDVDAGTSLTYTLDASVAGLTLNENGSYSFNAADAAYQNLAEGATRNVVANYTVTDQHSASSTSTLTITLTGTNDMPVALVDVNSGFEDSTIAGSVAGNDTDVDSGTTLIYKLDAPIDGLTLNSDGSYSFDAGHATYQSLAQGATTDVAASYTVTDEHGATSTGTLTITLTGTNDAPVAQARTTAAVEGAAVITGQVLATDADNHGSLTYTLIDGAPAGLAFNPDGSFSFDPTVAAYEQLSAGQTQDVVVHYKANDGIADSNVQTLTVTITGTNDAPIAVANGGAVTEDVSSTPVTGNVLVNDTDVDTADTHAVTAVNGSAAKVGIDVAGTYGTLHLNADGSYTYALDNSKQPVQGLAQGQQVTDNFTYTNSDDHGGSSTSTLTITVTGTNDAPTGSAAAALPSGTQDTAYVVSEATLLQGFADADAGTVLHVTNLSANHGSVTANANGTFTVTPTTGYSGPVTLSYAVSDGAASTAATEVFTLVASNHAPIITSNGGGNAALLTVFEGAAGVTTVSATDADPGNTLTYSIAGGADAGKFIIHGTTGALSFVSAPNYETPTDVGANNVYDVVVRVSDNLGAFDQQALAVTVANVNEAPSGNNNSIGIVEDKAYTFKTSDFGFSDADSPANTLIAVKITTLPATGELLLNNVAVAAGASVSAADIADGRLTFVPAENSTTTATFSFQVQDSGGTANGGIDLDATPNTMSFIISADVDDMGKSGGNNDTPYAIAVNAGNVSIGDGGGTDVINEATNSNSYSSFSFERFGDNLEFKGVSGGANAVHLTIIDQYTASSQIETMSFTSGGTVGGAGGFTLGTGTYTFQSLSTGTNSSEILAGASSNDTLNGGGGNDIVFGGAGNDRLIGGAGNDLLGGGRGADTFVFDSNLSASANLDTLVDFEHGIDTIELSAAKFNAEFINGVLKATSFVANSGGVAANTSQHILFDTATGNLFYDADGSGNGAKVQFAHVDLTGMSGGSIDNTDFKIGS